MNSQRSQESVAHCKKKATQERDNISFFYVIVAQFGRPSSGITIYIATCNNAK